MKAPLCAGCCCLLERRPRDCRPLQVKPDCVLQAEDDGASLRSLGVKGIVSGKFLTRML